ncbi:GNAT family N-acetyltransferase [Frankia sp. QA3]|uniref:GNAT family N-acetyltransferase n=1 Tax=Frankia sp. QA3 TaxID=710111 RepID=UPI000269C6E6|nr:GNAT family N-acetyltransferase [Frankia sp. QA3]EIV93602.1 acetyltransferase [Frankia sp. QA3]
MITTAGGEEVLGGAEPLRYRLARPEDDEIIATIDGSFTSNSVFEVTATGEGFSICEKPVAPPIHKVFPVEDADEEQEGDDPALIRTIVACAGEELCGFVEASFDPWNSRLTICDIEVSPDHRRRGVGRTLMNHAFDFARECGAGHVWLEVTNINAPAIRAYLRMGFTFCGLDILLYEGTESAGERALFMSRQLP